MKRTLKVPAISMFTAIAMGTARFRNGVLLAMSMLSIPSMPLKAEDAPKYEGTVLPSKEAPDFVKEQWENAVANGQFKQRKRDWTEVGLPAGLEKQVWDAWAPGAKRVWRSIGPGYANVIYDGKVDNGVISIVVDLGGLVQSRDGGRSWRPVSHHLTQSQYYTFDISPGNPDIMAVGGMHIDHTLDGGRSWSPVFDEALPPFKPMRVVPGKALSGAIAYGAIRFNADGSKVFTSPGAFGHALGPRKGLEPEMASWLKRKFIYIGDGKVSNFKAIELGSYAGIRSILPHFSNPDLAYASFSDGSIYICRNARAHDPVFTELSRPDTMKNFQAISMDVSPDDQNTLLLALLEQGDAQDNARSGSKSKLVLAKVCENGLDCRELAVNGRVTSAKWNPNNSRQVVLAGPSERGVYVSDDGMQSFGETRFPDENFPPEHTTGYSWPRKIVFDRKSKLAAALSVTGGWFSNDQFKSVEDLIMTHDDARQTYGNKGVAFQECVVSVCIRKNYTYFCTNDHGAWRSDGKDTANWHKISDNPGMPRPDSYRLAYPMAVSEDESYIYLAAHMNNWKPGKHTLMLSRDKGETWQDVTERLGLGAVVEEGIERIFFDPTDSKTQWILAADRLFISIDGGKIFRSATPPSAWLGMGTAYDPAHKILYLGTSSGLFKSLDLGMTWKELPFDFVAYNVGVLANGDLVVSDDGRLMVIPYSKIDAGKIEEEMIRMTIGDDVASAACGQRTFAPIACDGMDILAIPFDGWNHSNFVRDMGALISRDGGSTFSWITYDLPCSKGSTNPFSMALRNGKVILGTRGVHECDLN